MPEPFTTQRLIRFSHCDPAGIVFFVNFFEMISGIVEDWFREAVHLPFQEKHLERRVGFPIVSTGCAFFRPCHPARHKVAMVSLDTFGSMPIPDDMRAKMRPYCVPGSAGG